MRIPPPRHPVVLAALLAALTFLVGTRCGTQEVEVGDAPDAAVLTEPQAFLEDHVDVSAVVTEVVTPNAFFLGSERAGEQALLVISATPADVSEGREVIVVGRVLPLIADFADDFGFEITPEVEEFRGDPVLVAESVRPAVDG